MLRFVAAVAAVVTVLVLDGPHIALAQLQPPSKEREEQLLGAQQRLEHARTAATNANRRVREAESNLATARARQKVATDNLERAERTLEDARTRAAAAQEAFQAESAKFQELRNAQ